MAATGYANDGVARRPEAISFNPIRRVLDDVLVESRARGNFPPGPTKGAFARAV
jgi:hypothetical protein